MQHKISEYRKWTNSQTFLLPLHETETETIFTKANSSMHRKSPFSPYTLQNIHPGFSVDCVILTFYKKKIRILLTQFLGSKFWQLPGGFMFKDECSDEAAKRVLEERTGLTDVFLKQFHLFSNPGRTDLEMHSEILEELAHREGFTGQEEKWYIQRFITLGYYALVKYDTVSIPKRKDDVTKWFDIQNLPPLYADHGHIIKTSLDMLRFAIPVTPIGYELLPEKFTISELRKIYEIVLGKEFDRRNFQRKALASGKIIQLNETKSDSPYNPPILYKFDPEAMKEKAETYF